MHFFKHSKKAILMAGVAVFSIFTAPQIAFAQSTSAGTQSNNAVDEIVVTARKREESLQEYAGAITAITSDSLETNQIVSMQDIRGLVPNLYIEEALGGATTPKIFARGIGIDNPDVSFDSPIGIYIDGVYHARAFGSLSDLYDVEQVEFLRGPQGTLYGRNNSAGALRVITKKPTLDHVEAGGSIGFGTKKQVNANAYLSMPLIEDKLGLRVSVARRGNDGFMREANTGQKLKQDDLWNGRASLMYVPNDEWEAVLRADVSDNSGIGSSSSSTVPAFNADDDLFTVVSNLVPANSLKVAGTSLTVNRAGEVFDFTSVTAYRNIRMKNTGGDADGTPLSLLEGAVQNLNAHEITQEAYVTASSGSIDWTAGVFYMHELNKVQQSFNVFPNVFGPATTQIIRHETDAFSIYGEADLAVSDALTLTGGLRYTDESKSAVLDSFNNNGSFGFDFEDEIGLSKLTWKLGADYVVSDDFFLYASASTGFRSGGFGFNPAARSAANIVNDTFGPEEALSFEGGFKKNFNDGRVQLNATYFYVEYDSLQLAVAGAGGITVNTPDASVHGLEAEMTARLMDGLTLNATLGTQFDTIKESDLALKNTPGWQGRLGLTYNTSMANGNVTLAGDISYTDDYTVSTANTVFVDAHPMLNAMVRWDAPSENWGVSLTGKNLTDEFYPTLGFKIIPGLLDTVFPNNPRRYMASLHFKY
jgi:iron complex outermembrane receptor protein